MKHTPTLYLHIGYPKTGTRWLQAYLAANAAGLEKNGIKYATTGRTVGDGNVSVDHEHLAAKLLFRPPQESVDELNALRREVSESRCRCSVVSSESLSLLSAKPIQILRKFMADVDVRVVLYIRPQPQALESRYLQALKSGNAFASFSAYVKLETASRRWHYRERLRDWEVFGKDNIIVRVYDRDRFPNRDIVEDFRCLLGVDRSQWAGMVAPDIRVANPTLGSKSYVALQSIVRHPNGFVCPIRRDLERHGKRHSRAFSELQRVFEDLGWNERRLHILTDDIVHQCEAEFRADNACLVRDYLEGDETTLSFGRQQLEPVSSLPELSPEDWAKLMAGLLRRIESNGRAVKSEVLRHRIRDRLFSLSRNLVRRVWWPR